MGEIVPIRRLRWTAVLYYRTEAGVIDNEVTFDEIADLEAYVERGPDWHALDRIEIRLTHNPMPSLTIEKSMML